MSLQETLITKALKRTVCSFYGCAQHGLFEIFAECHLISELLKNSRFCTLHAELLAVNALEYCETQQLISTKDCFDRVEGFFTEPTSISSHWYEEEYASFLFKVKKGIAYAHDVKKNVHVEPTVELDRRIAEMELYVEQLETHFTAVLASMEPRIDELRKMLNGMSELQIGITSNGTNMLERVQKQCLIRMDIERFYLKVLVDGMATRPLCYFSNNICTLT